MRYIDTAVESLIWPEQSVSGFSGSDLLDTGWDVHWPGPGRVYLDDRDIQDIVSASIERPLVVEVLVGRGWTPPGETAAATAGLEAELDAAVAELAAARAECDGLLLALQRVAPYGVASVAGDVVTVAGEPVAVTIFDTEEAV